MADSGDGCKVDVRSKY